MAEQNRESSMEEILSSIKRIISEDKAIEIDGGVSDTDERKKNDPVKLSSVPIEKTASETETSDGEVLELTNEVRDDSPSSARGVFGDRRKEERLINDQKLDSMRQSLSALVAMESANGPAPARQTNETSLEEMARELMRPMLKEWLDENLPTLVEELVAHEIQRISQK